MKNNEIKIQGARVHNLKNVSVNIPREKLVDRIWTDGAEYVDENALSVAVNRLRSKLGAQKNIKTVYGVGYTWVEEND